MSDAHSDGEHGEKILGEERRMSSPVDVLGLGHLCVTQGHLSRQQLHPQI